MGIFLNLVRSLDISKNEIINFSDDSSMAILDNVTNLNLSSSLLNDKKFNISMDSWKRSNLSNLINLDISDNKGLSPHFF